MLLILVILKNIAFRRLPQLRPRLLALLAFLFWLRIVFFPLKFVSTRTPSIKPYKYSLFMHLKAYGNSISFVFELEIYQDFCAIFT